MLEEEDLNLIQRMIDFYYRFCGEDSIPGEYDRAFKLEKNLKMELLYWNCGK